MQEEQVKAKIQRLINDFRANYSKYKQMSEPDIETKLVEPLFEALGWLKSDFDKRSQARREGKRGIADYAFKIGDKIVFYLEVKKVGISLGEEANKQVVSYALSKKPTVAFAVSTNFEELNIFCVEQEKPLQQTFWSFTKPENYISEFQNLLYLSKENFESGATLQKAEDLGRLKKRMAIDKVLLEDLIHMRKLIVEDIGKNYSKYDLNEKEEIVQRIIDRLIFIRRSEDIGINPNNISLNEVRELPHDDAYPKLKQIFRKYNDVYNSGLFAIEVDNDCDKIELNGAIIKNLVKCLYESKDGQYFYNFDWIDADVLGQVYEQYLGKLLEQLTTGKTKLRDGQAHKKDQGIYYTPTFIVDYIVKNTLGELFQDKKIKVKGLKVLDPACGSGSFLIKAFDYLYENLYTSDDAKQYKLDSQGAYSIKTEILKKNIYGVDLDNKAVEITKLNLLLKAAEKDRKLPEEVDLHIKHGNSLIDEESITPQAFKWEEKFSDLIQFDKNKELIKGYGFDIIIGNPPYGAQLTANEKKFLSGKAMLVPDFETADYFIHIAIKYTKENGFISFIIPNTILVNLNAKKFRQYLLDKTYIVNIVDLSKIKVFSDPSVRACILVLKKSEKKGKTHFLQLNKFEKFEEVLSMETKELQQKIDNWLTLFDNDDLNNKIITKIKSNSILLGDLTESSQGLIPYDKYRGHSEQTIKNRIWHADFKKDKTYKKELRGGDVTRYGLQWNGKQWISYGDWLAAPRKPKFFTVPRLLIREITSDRDGTLYATFTDSEYYNNPAIINVIQRDSSLNLKYVLGIINSKLIAFYNYSTSPKAKKGLFPKILVNDVRNLPIANASGNKKIELIELVDRMMLLNDRLIQLGEKNTLQTKELKDVINTTDNKINKLIYELYNLTNKEIELIEKS